MDFSCRVRVDLNSLHIKFACLLLLVGCDGERKPPEPQVMNVRAQVVSYVTLPRTESLTGQFEATIQSDMSFQIGGRIEKRIAEVGDRVAVGDILAQLDSLQQIASLNAAQASLKAAQATLEERNSNLARLEQLLPQKATSKQEYDDSKAAMLVAKGNVNISEAGVATAQSQLAYTLLRATVSGVVIARQAEVGQVVGPGEAVFTIAADGGRQAVFEVFPVDFSVKPITDNIDLSLQSDPSIKAVGVIRETSPVIDEKDGTIRVKVAVADPPPGMTLGSTVVGVAHFKPSEVVSLPWTSLSRQGNRPAVWVVDPKTGIVSSRSVVVGSYVSSVILVDSGLETGDLVVTDGAEMIRPGQKVQAVIDSPALEITP